ALQSAGTGGAREGGAAAIRASADAGADEDGRPGNRLGGDDAAGARTRSDHHGDRISPARLLRPPSGAGVQPRPTARRRLARHAVRNAPLGGRRRAQAAREDRARSGEPAISEDGARRRLPVRGAKVAANSWPGGAGERPVVSWVFRPRRSPACTARVPASKCIVAAWALFDTLLR